VPFVEKRQKSWSLWIIKSHKNALEIEIYLPSFSLSLWDRGLMINMQNLFSTRETWSAHARMVGNNSLYL